VVASSLPALEQLECDRNEFDDTHYKLVSDGSKLDGFIGCTSGCEPKTCDQFDGYWGQCSGYGEFGGNDHYKFFSTRTNGMDEAGAAKNSSFPLCAGLKPNPTPRHMTNTTTTPTTHIPSASSHGLPVYAYAAIGGGAFVFVGGAILLARRVRTRTAARLRSYNTNSADDGAEAADMQLLAFGGVEGVSDASVEYFDPQMTIARKDVTLDNVVGEGNFGKVYAGTAKDPRRNRQVVAVAVKAPSAAATAEFELEMELMSQLTRLGGHPHIVEVIGCVYGKEPLLVLEFCAGGSLKAVLTASRTTTTFEVVLKPVDLIAFGHQVALAMTFLEHHKLLHRDLATRNVLLTEHRACKLADFGLSRAVTDANEYYRRTTGASAPIPVRWMAPETLDFNVSTIESDRWSFGVLLWEIYSQAARPYAGLDNHEIARHVRNGLRLEQPAVCPDEIYSLMLQCFAAEPASRPSFVQIAHDLDGHLEASVV
jgi:hypothetical protein